MFPGRFPSPSPSREVSPISTPKVCDDVQFLFTVPKSKVSSLDFTASTLSRKRPHFADTQSEPVLSKVIRKSPTSKASYPTARRIRGERRVSDSAYSPSRYGSQPSVDRSNNQPIQRRVTSAQSPATSSRSPSRLACAAPTQLSASQSSHLIDVRLRQALRSPLTTHDTPLLGDPPKVGEIYVLTDLLDPQRGVKIGWTNRADYGERINEHRTKCRIQHKVVHVSHDVLHSYRVERLIHLELTDRRLPWSCMGHKTTATRHEEWHDISVEEATGIVKKWAKFMNEQRPYDWRGQLSSFWEYSLRARRLVVDDSFGHDERREQWTRMLREPTHRERFCFIMDVLRRNVCTARDVIWKTWQHCRAYFWQMLTLAYSFVTLLLCRNAFASSAFALVSVCAYLSIWSKLPLKRVRSKSS